VADSSAGMREIPQKSSYSLAMSETVTSCEWSIAKDLLLPTRYYLSQLPTEAGNSASDVRDFHRWHLFSVTLIFVFNAAA